MHVRMRITSSVIVTRYSLFHLESMERAWRVESSESGRLGSGSLGSGSLEGACGWRGTVNLRRSVPGTGESRISNLESRISKLKLQLQRAGVTVEPKDALKS